MDITEYNRQAWDQKVAKENRWTISVSSEQIARARQGDWELVLTPQKSVPKAWFPELKGIDVLGLASGGGQQCPILAAAGANVTLFDNSPAQLEQDRTVAQRDGLQIETIQGDMQDLSRFETESFDLVFNPCSLLFIPEVESVFKEISRILRPGGRFLCGFTNPLWFIFDEHSLQTGPPKVRHALPYSDLTHLTPEELEQLRLDAEPFIFSHSLEEMIAGQLRAGLVLRDLYEDRTVGESISDYLPTYIATLAEKQPSVG